MQFGDLRAVIFGVIILITGPMACAAGPTTAPASTRPTIEQRTQLLAEQWKAKLQAEKMTVLIASPFVLAGDGTAAQLAGYRDGTILPAVQALKEQYFKTPIDEPMLIILVETEEPYKRLAKKWFDDDDVSPFGFYLHSRRTMLMNAGTGTGTLVHELTHALIDPDFPEVPDWFNEGLASLYEQSQFGPGGKTIRGLVNWRLPPLQAAIQADTLRSTAELTADPDFRNANRVRLNYAHARYLMLYLQERRLLTPYYAMFRSTRKDDPTGIKSLEKVIAPQSLDAFDQDWRKWVAGLGR